MTVGEEFKAATQANLIDLAKEALDLHAKFERLRIASVEDATEFRRDLGEIKRIARELDLDAMRCERWYRA
jgi:hypothetical protein